MCGDLSANAVWIRRTKVPVHYLKRFWTLLKDLAMRVKMPRYAKRIIGLKTGSIGML